MERNKLRPRRTRRDASSDCPVITATKLRAFSVTRILPYSEDSESRQRVTEATGSRVAKKARSVSEPPSVTEKKICRGAKQQFCGKCGLS